MSWRPLTKTGVGILTLLIAIISLLYNSSRLNHLSPLSPPPADTDLSSISTMAAISRTLVKKVLSQETSEVVVGLVDITAIADA
jgi:hypothetical protein